MTPTARHALVVSERESLKRVVTQGLTIFRPGFHVASASDLATAREWLDSLDDPILVIDAGVSDEWVVGEWLTENGIPAERVVLIDDNDRGWPQGPNGITRLRGPLRLSVLLTSVSALAEAVEPVRSTEIEQDVPA